MKKNIVIILSLVIIVSTLALWRSVQPTKKSIAVVVTLSHPALESTHAGFVNALKGASPIDADLIYFNAEGNVAHANLIAQKIASDDNIIAAFAIGTLAAQTLVKAEKHKPIVFAAVFDPRVLGTTSTNVCGLSDAIAASYQIDTIIKLVPHIKRWALLYTPSETNSISMIDNLARELDTRAFTYTRAGVHEMQQIVTASRAACEQADAVIIPLDNQLVASFPAVVKATRDLPCLIITSNESGIHQGASIAFGVDYRKSGEHAGRLMKAILARTTSPEQIGVINPDALDLFVNDHVMKEKNIILDETSVPTIIHIKGDNNG